MSTECLPENFVLPPATFPSVKGWWSWSLAATVSAAAIGFCVWGCQSADTLQDNRRCELRYGTFSFGLSADGNTLAVGAAGESGSSDNSLVLLLRCRNGSRPLNLCLTSSVFCWAVRSIRKLRNAISGQAFRDAWSDSDWTEHGSSSSIHCPARSHRFPCLLIDDWWLSATVR